MLIYFSFFLHLKVQFSDLFLQKTDPKIYSLKKKGGGELNFSKLHYPRNLYRKNTTCYKIIIISSSTIDLHGKKK